MLGKHEAGEGVACGREDGGVLPSCGMRSRPTSQRAGTPEMERSPGKSRNSYGGKGPVPGMECLENTNILYRLLVFL